MSYWPHYAYGWVTCTVDGHSGNWHYRINAWMVEISVQRGRWLSVTSEELRAAIVADATQRGDYSNAHHSLVHA